MKLSAELIIVGAVYVISKRHVLASASSRTEIDEAVGFADFHRRA